MSNTCKVCRHPELAKIDSALIAQEPLRDIARRFTGTTKDSLARHAEHLPAAIVKASEAAEVARADTLLEQVVKHRDRAVWFVEQAQTIVTSALDAGENEEAIKAITAVAGPLREAKGALDLLGRVTGELQDKPLVNIDQRSIGTMADAAVLEQMQAEIAKRLKK